ncbi:MAG TPA: magnesium transporter CorA family protein [Actinophytocola sp.]|uniref:magnesium transporter CorA family protein n=1 Tax=Actinophytocola sp. TaxID=1872138 RepID=UPI002DBE3E25|nr:magnesium transporter CorA family protein [Actinophytocola sp.]HEU5473390.1 magnesium transporter CorA family protein [Actinophytocola sp.]
MVRTRLYRDGALAAEDFPVADVAEHLRDPAATVWVGMTAPTRDDLAGIAEELGLHELAIEDATSDRHQRPKLDRYDGHLFLVAYQTRLDPASGALATHEIAAFVTGNALVTVHPDAHPDVDGVLARWDSAQEHAAAGVAFLLHGLLDQIAATQFDAAQALDDEFESLEDMVFDDRADHRSIQRRALRLRKSLTRLRQVALPMRDLLADLLKPDAVPGIGPLAPYFQDVHDRVLRTAENILSLRELVAIIRETQLGIQANRLNSVMKKVTSWAAIIAVPTAITGFYGQNLPYPGAEQLSGFWVSTTLIVLLSGGLYVLFKRRDWL